MNKMRLQAIAALVLASLMYAGVATAAETSAEEAAIRKTAAAYLEAVNRGDVDAMRAFWTENGNIVDESGQSTSVKEMRRPADPGSADAAGPLRLKVRTESIRFVTPTVAVEDGTSEFTSAAQGQATRGRYSVVWVRRDGKWLIDAVREAAITAPPSANRIEQLDWMVGEWAEEGDAAAFTASFEWTADKNFVVGQLRIQPRENDSHVITQRIGWDAAMGKIRSWNFDSHGGFSEGVWTRDGDVWSVATTGVLPDGKRTRGRRVLQRVDEDSVLLASLDFQIDGEPLPDLTVTLVRKPVAKKSR